MHTSNIANPTEATSRFGHAVIEMLTRTVIILSATLTFAAVAAVACHRDPSRRVSPLIRRDVFILSRTAAMKHPVSRKWVLSCGGAID